MHTVRVSLTGTVVLALLGGLGGAVLSEDDVDPMTPAYFTLTRGPAPESIGGLAPDDLDGDGFPELRGQLEVGIPVEASDPRVSGLWTIYVNADVVGVADGTVDMAVTSHRLQNDEGGWSGTGTAISAYGSEGDLTTGLTVMTGERAYEGLSLVLSQTYKDGDESYWGIILPNAKVPPMPDPIEPPAE
jgi:hypothetical protein